MIGATAEPCTAESPRPDGDGIVLLAEQTADVGGQERVVDALLRRYPRARAFAPRFSATCEPDDPRPQWDDRVELVGRAWGRRRGYLVPLYASSMARATLGPARLVLSVTHGGWTLAAPVPDGARHVAYSSGLNTWLYDLARLSLRQERPLMRTTLPPFLPALRGLDRRLMRKTDCVLANSRYSAQALAEAHGRDTEVIYPPVRTDYFTPGFPPGQGDHYLVVARMTAQKRVDIVVEAFRQLGLPLVVAGGGPELERIRRLAPPNVAFVGAVDDPALRDLYRSSRGLICPSVETFGIAMAEALSSGLPVIAAREGGALEVVEHGRTGLLLDAVGPDTIAAAVRELEERQFDPDACRNSALPFSEAAFGEAMDTVLAAELSLAGGNGRAAAASSRLA
ncbi:MAG TPA: glycosyltransferase [Thermoleophilaceae bacterium]